MKQKIIFQNKRNNNLKGIIILNCKNYLEVAGEKILQLSEIARDNSKSNQVTNNDSTSTNILYFTYHNVLNFLLFVNI